MKLRSDFLREFKSTSAYVPAIVSRPRKSEWDAHRLTNSKPNDWHGLIIFSDKKQLAQCVKLFSIADHFSSELWQGLSLIT
ncbi:hypothetical protein EFP47_01695 [Lactiplantibacillus pentosus]|uniref:Uncharacterized protein n=1 Tax=Lactiplantibacillus pentosus DSM 20314 TaxID=1423791 RepID=A0A837R6V4_LACPE|nr:hypothetical protein FD24_GL001779 [Lactiplantibacillus pentosus DSM 20314]MCT3308402.1 hypothetical protein [Lactiplantibacillus pentosus]